MGVEKKVVNIVPLDFEHFRSRLAKNWSPVTLGNEIQRVRIVFKFAFDSGLIDVPIRYGSSFNRPSRRVLRKERAKKGVMMFEADDIRRMLDAADSSIKAMILLGINCGLGNSDIGNLPIDAADLNKKWLNYPRPKTGIDRRVPLWDETVTAIKKYMAKRPTPKQKEHKKLLFITKYGDAWHKNTSDNPISKEIRKLLDTLKLHRKGLGFYSLRHSFETVAGGAKDQVALDHVMGHVREDMASVYRERIEDERLLAVVSFVRSWLFPQTDSTTLKKAQNH
jgi:integrase